MALFDDPFGAIQRDIERARRRREDSEKVKDSRQELRDAWVVVSNGPDPAPLFALGRLLVAGKHDFWVQFWRVSLARDAELRGGEFSFGTYCCAATLKMLDAACRQDESSLCELMSQATQLQKEFVWSSAFSDALEILELWIEDGQLPDTPYLRRQELVTALKGIRGMSASGICRMVKKEQLKEKDPLSKHFRYRHADPETHRLILSKVVRYLDRKKKPFHQK